ncbi:MAG: pyridoxal phosphate-dependent aminotransferase [Tissierellales bacterium]|nr:pyridoxal phosphate-dependent aminotransferase [Tissierellales bacterium]MBN2826349.1 pyridoxal phosphate-dependent aminotransferase [Tissierellales bacterium]
MNKFDKIINRKNTNCCKWDLLGEDILPLWVADMDFEVCPPIKDALIEVASHGVYGYTLLPDSYYESFMDWQKKRNNWKIEKEWISFSPGIVPAINMLVRALTQTGDKVILQTPVYYPFYKAVINNGAQILKNPLKLVNHQYEMDFDDLEEKAKDPRACLLILCSPHNPVGRVWNKEELERLGNICIKNDVMVISDEIHSDLIYKGYKHIPFSSITKEFSEISISCLSPSKTFNIAGLQISTIVIPNSKIRTKFNNVLENNFLTMPNIFGVKAYEAAYKEGESWLEELMEYLSDNLEFLYEFIEKKLPKVKVIKPQGTYLVWLDFTELKLTKNELKELMLKKAKVFLDEGYIFGAEGEGYERINIACPRSILEEALNRIEKALNSIS